MEELRAEREALYGEYASNIALLAKTAPSDFSTVYYPGASAPSITPSAADTDNTSQRSVSSALHKVEGSIKRRMKPVKPSYR